MVCSYEIFKKSKNFHFPADIGLSQVHNTFIKNKISSDTI